MELPGRDDEVKKKPKLSVCDILPGLNRSPGPEILLINVIQAFYSSNIGQSFVDASFRYAKRYPMSNYDALHYIGADAHPIEHQLMLGNDYVSHVAQSGVFGDFTEEDLALARFIGFFHELGESTDPSLKEAGLTLVGDIPYGTKTDENRLNEQKIRLHILKSNPAFADIGPDFLARFDAIVMHKPIEGDERIHQLVETAHTLQAFDAACTANYSRKRLSPKDPAYAALVELSKDVAASSLAKLMKHTPGAPFTKCAKLLYLDRKITLEHTPKQVVGRPHLGRQALIGLYLTGSA